ncbi:MAG: dockerin type I domain-containing protein [Candidatus Methanogasteraceae archaeon]
MRVILCILTLTCMAILATSSHLSAADDAPTSSFSDPKNDLVYIYSMLPVPPEKYIGYVDVIACEAEKTVDSLNFRISANSSIPQLSDTVFWTILLDENNDPSDNCLDHPTMGVDTMYTVIYDSSTGSWKIERATYEPEGWWRVRPTDATWGLTSSVLVVHISIPLAELGELGDVVPWKVMTETFNGATIGDLAPEARLAYLGDLAPEPEIYNPDNGSWISGATGIGAVEVWDAGDIASTSFEYSPDGGATWHYISRDYGGDANTYPCESYDASRDGWGTVWDTICLAEGWYCIRATMTDLLGQPGQSQIMVYLDPMPPTQTILQPGFDQMVSGTTAITAGGWDLGIGGVVFSVFEVNASSGIEKNVPHTPQGYGCLPASAAASLLWLDNYTSEAGEKPFDDVVPEGLEEPEKITEKLNEMFKTDNRDPAGSIGTHLTSDVEAVSGLKKYIEERKDAGMKGDFVVKAFGRKKTATYDTLPANTDWVQFYRTMLPHEDILLLLQGTKKNGGYWGHAVTANSFRPSFMLLWTSDGCIWEPVPPYTIDFMDHNDDTGYRAVEMDREGNITGLEEYYDELSKNDQNISGMIVVSPKTNYEELLDALKENRTTPCDWRPVGYSESPVGIVTIPFPVFVSEWDTTNVVDGSYLLKSTAINRAGNSASDITWITVDNNAPCTTKTIGTPKYKEGYYLTPDTEITLSANDGCGIGVDLIYYRIWNNGTWSDWTRQHCAPVVVTGTTGTMSRSFADIDCSVSFTLPGTCIHHIEYYATDLLNNTEDVQSQTHIVDNEAPVTIKTVGYPGYAMNATVFGEERLVTVITNETLIALNASDNCCRIKSITLRNNNTKKRYHVKMIFKKDGTRSYSGHIIKPNKSSKFNPIFSGKKVSVTISEYIGRKRIPVVPEFELTCQHLGLIAVLGGGKYEYDEKSGCYRHNTSAGPPSPFRIDDLLLEEFCLKKCSNHSEVTCWSGVASTRYPDYYEGTGSWTPNEYSEPFTLDGNGIHLLGYYSLDNLGNTEEVNTTEGINSDIFFLTEQSLEPFFVTPSNDSLVYGNVTLRAGEASGSRVSHARFSYSTDGVNWTYISVDCDGSEPTVGGELARASDWGDGWSVYWDTSDMEEGLYHIRVEMYGLEGIGAAQISIYLDPTPPMPEIRTPLDEDVVCGSVQLSTYSADEDISRVLWEYSNKTQYYEKDIEKKIQFHYCRNIDGRNLSEVCCGPTSAASCLKYWATHGYSSITGNGTINQSQLVNRLARLMKTDENGTTDSNFKKGIEDYLNERGCGCSNPHGLRVGVETNKSRLTFARYRDELEANREDVLWGYEWNYNNNTTGHWVVGKSVNNTRRADGSHEVDIMCPTFGNVSNVSMYDNGTLYRPDVMGRWRYPSIMVTVSEKGSYESPVWVEIANVTDPAGGWAATWDTTDIADGYYFIRATAVDRAGNEGTDTMVVRVDNAALPPKGDLNGDGEITAADAVIALAIAAGSYPFDALADVSGDGQVTSLDALMILQAAGGAINIRSGEICTVVQP